MDTHDPAQPERVIYIYCSPYGGAIVYSDGHIHYESDVAPTADVHIDGCSDVCPTSNLDADAHADAHADAGTAGADTAPAVSSRFTVDPVAGQVP